MTSSTATRTALSLAIAAASLGLAYIPMGDSSLTITVVAGSELQEPLMRLAESFERANPKVALELQFQGSQDMINRYLDDRNDFEPTLLIPANGELLDELEERWQAQASGEAFQNQPQPLAKTQLVAIAWPERGNLLFANGQFTWERLGEALKAKTWDQLGGNPDWGSFDFLMTDPIRSNSSQLALSLWTQAVSGGDRLSQRSFTQPDVQNLFASVKRSVYQPPRSTDILLQEFITRGPNDADVAMVYESIALYRWAQSTQGSRPPYRIYYLNPTLETVATGAIVQRGVERDEAQAAAQFLDYLSAPEQQQVFVQHGFRPISPGLDLGQVADSPWQNNIPGAAISPPQATQPLPDSQTLGELIRTWQRTP